MTLGRVDPVDGDSWDAKASASQWEAACAALGKRLKVGQGPFGTGMFGDTSCDSRDSKGNGWELTVEVTVDEVRIEVRNGRRLESSLKFTGNSRFLKYLSDPGFADMVAFGINRGLPALLTATESSQAKGLFARGIAISDATSQARGRFDPPGELTLFYLDYDPKLDIWMPDIIGKASLRYYDKAKFSSKASSKAKYLGKVFWDATLRGTIRGETQIWGQVTEGRGRWIEESEVSSKVQTAFEQLEVKNGKRRSTLFGSVSNYLEDSAASGYFGARCGKQFLAGDALLGNSNFCGGLIEIRGGPLEGLRLYYDKVPRVEAQVDSGPTYFEWSRATAGISLGLYPGVIVDRIDFVPKLGVWDVAALLPVKTQSGTLRQEFSIDKRMSFSLEVGAEWIGSWYTIRTWASQDQSLTVGKIDTSGIITTRLGLDTYLPTGPTIRLKSTSIKCTMLIFAELDEIKLSAPKGSSSESDRLRIDEIDFDSGYAGGGIVIAW
jgi:hypothetical protein